MFSLSVCLIVKNEEKVIKRVLDCASKFADEIIIVDSDSTDKTVEIAKKYTDKIYNFKWQNDFSMARNYSFSLATKDYIMWLDADDFITESNIEKIKILKNEKDVDVFMLKYIMGFNENNKPTFTFYRERIIKRSLNLKWQGIVHEVITPVGNIKHCDIEIQHRKVEVKDSKRNLKIYQNALKQNKQLNARETYYYARELFYNCRYFTCIKFMKKFLKYESKYIADIYGAYAMIAECYLIKGQNAKVINELLKFIKEYAPTSEICCLLATAYKKSGNLKNAIFWFKNATHCEKLIFGFNKSEYEKLIPYLELTLIYYSLNNLKMALFYHNLCVKTDKTHQSVQHNIKFFNTIK